MTSGDNPLSLLAPFGGELVDLVVSEGLQAELKSQVTRLPSIQLSERPECDLEMLATGALSPLGPVYGQRRQGRAGHL